MPFLPARATLPLTRWVVDIISSRYQRSLSWGILHLITRKRGYDPDEEFQKKVTIMRQSGFDRLYAGRETRLNIKWSPIQLLSIRTG